MSQHLPGQNYPLRVSAAILFLLGGFIFLPLFILGGLVVWSLIDDLRNPTKPEDHPLFDPKLVSSSDPTWPDRWLSLCESAAETGFLTAVMKAYGLSPSNGKLVGNGLSFDLQVKMPPYRADFLANDRLVVEIDGAAYHSSPEAVARDAERDEILRSRGYSILRIPAKVVFASPDVAVRWLRTALVNLPLRSEPAARQASFAEKALHAARSFGAGLDHFNQFAQDYESPLKPPPLPNSDIEFNRIVMEKVEGRMGEYVKRYENDPFLASLMLPMHRDSITKEEEKKLREELASG